MSKSRKLHQDQHRDRIWDEFMKSADDKVVNSSFPSLSLSTLALGADAFL
jgi:hypothetical protein